MSAKINISDLSTVPSGTRVTCDVLIVGSGPAGLSVARGLEGTGLHVLILESGGLEETARAEALNEVVADPSNWTQGQAERRQNYHAPQAAHWSHARQGYGVRCRVLGGSTAAWAGKSAAFDEIDFKRRSWVPNSGWPIDLNQLGEYLDLAATHLNLSTNCYDDRLWDMMRRTPPDPRPDPDVLQSFFWQFARSKLRPTQVMQVGDEFRSAPPENSRIYTGATVVEILTDESGRHITGALAADDLGERHTIRARTIVLAASAIENARLLLVSNRHNAVGIGNEHDNVGRYLMDHPCAVVGSFPVSAIKKMASLYGFYGLRTDKGINMYMRGIAPTPSTQQANELLNCAAFMPGERAPDNPWDAAKRLLTRQSKSYVGDVVSILKSPTLIAKGAGRLMLQSDRMPKSLSNFIVNQVVRFTPGLAVEEFLTAGIQHKLIGLSIQVICEQVPHPENRVFLSDRLDRFGIQLPYVRWQVGDMEKQSIQRFAELLRGEFQKAGMPAPELSTWVRQERGEDAAIIDWGHSSGTTRMSSEPSKGVVDENCKVHGVDGLFVAGASVFPTSGHANPTLMIVAMALRLADHLKRTRRTLNP